MPSNTGAGVASSDTSPRDRFEQIIRADTVIWPALDIARSLALPDWLIASGAVYQSIWNALIGRPCGYGLKDIDLIYFDDSDLSWGAEDNCIRKADAAFRAVNLGVPVETRNQARVHLWFEDKFGVPYAPLTSSAESLSRYESTASAIGIRLDDNDRLHIIAPFGIEDAMAMRFRPNTHTDQEIHSTYDRKASRCQRVWPEAKYIAR